MVRELYNYHDKFDSVNTIQQKIKEEFSEHIARGPSFSVGYFEGRHQTKHWLISRQNVEKMHEKLQFLQQLYEDGILSHAEFMEQKGILDSLRKLN